MVSGKTKSVFGPIRSRRLGQSLGIDLLPFKTCPLDCVYCECGATTDLTLERREYCSTQTVLDEIDSVLMQHPKLDYLTFSGVGEPTLHSGIGRIIEHVKSHWQNVKICLITNAVLLGNPDLQNELRDIDLIMPSLDASCEEEYRTINRPHEVLTLSSLTDAIRSFRTALPHIPMLLEIFLIPGVNDSPESLTRFAEIVRSIHPDKLQLNSLDRPGVTDWIQIPAPAELERIRTFFEAEQVADAVEIISRVITQPVNPAVTIAEYNRNILNALRNGAETPRKIAEMTSYPEAQTATHLRRMEKAGLVSTPDSGKTYRIL